MKLKGAKDEVEKGIYDLILILKFNNQKREILEQHPQFTKQ